MWKAIGNIYRFLESVCREQRAGFIKCPGCSGSGISLSVQHPNEENHHSLICQHCRFCEGYGLLPLTGLRGFVLVGTNFLAQDVTPKLKTKEFSLTTSSSNSCINEINCHTSIEFKSCLNTDKYLVNPLSSPHWLADVKQWIKKTSSLDMEFTPQFPHSKNQIAVLFKSFMMQRPLLSAGLLVSLLASALSSHSADAHVIYGEGSLDDEAMGNGDNRPHRSEAIIQVGKEFDGCQKSCRHTKKRRNSLRKKAVGEAEARARANEARRQLLHTTGPA